MSAMASQITSLTIVYSTVWSGADQMIHQSSASLASVRGIHRSPLNSPRKGPVKRKMLPFDDVIMQLRIIDHDTGCPGVDCGASRRNAKGSDHFATPYGCVGMPHKCRARKHHQSRKYSPINCQLLFYHENYGMHNLEMTCLFDFWTSLTLCTNID